MRHKIAATVFTLLAVCTTTAWADVVAPDEPLPGMSDVELDERLRYLTVEIAKNAHYARAWHGVFVTMYGAGLMVESARAAIETESAARADYTYGAVKALIGVAGRLARPLRAVAGPSPEEVAPGDDRPARLQRLRVAEAMLRVDAKESDRRYSPIGHSLNVALNLIGALIVGLAYHDWGRAAESGGIGIAVGELSIWTQPWKAKSAWKSYSKRYVPVSSLPAARGAESVSATAASERSPASTVFAVTF